MSGRGSLAHPPTKTVLVFRNGDAFYTGRKFVINQRQSSTFDSFLNTVTRGITAHFGAVRNIYTPNKGHRVVDLEQLVNGEIYVAVGAERLKKNGVSSLIHKIVMIQPVVRSRIIVPARWKRISNELWIINVFTNGDILVPPAMVLIPKHTLASWENVLAMVTERVHLRSGAVHRLCMLNGRPVRGSYELQNNHYYVAVGKERFRSLPYHLAPSRKVIHNITDFFSPLLFQTVPTLRVCTETLPCTHRMRINCFSFLNMKLWMLLKMKRIVCTNGCIQHMMHVIRILSVYSEKSVFRATNKRKEAVVSSEVLEDENMKVDLPIEQVKTTSNIHDVTFQSCRLLNTKTKISSNVLKMLHNQQQHFRKKRTRYPSKVHQ
uniref:Si:dkey-25g12.4 n=1 Tax=Sinocyclocheilus rhinocerous TaxID=307959 RepID=A0A673FW75_9TELE